MKSRKQRKLEAKETGVKFVPQYNDNGVVTYEEFYGVGKTRFNNKFVNFNNKINTEVSQETTVNLKVEKDSYAELNNEQTVSVENNEDFIVVDTVDVIPIEVKKESKFKKKLKKLFGK